jgi:hypothetical protein
MIATLCSYEGFFGPHHPQTLGMAIALAEALCKSDHRELGRRLLERALADLTNRHDRFHPLRLRALELLLTLLCQERDWRRAVTVQRQLADWRLDLFGPDHPDSIAARDNLSTILASLMSSSGAFPA